MSLITDDERKFFEKLIGHVPTDDEIIAIKLKSQKSAVKAQDIFSKEEIEYFRQKMRETQAFMIDNEEARRLRKESKTKREFRRDKRNK